MAESVDPGAGGSLPWMDDAKALDDRKRGPARRSGVRLRGRGEEAGASARSRPDPCEDDECRGANGDDAAEATAGESRGEAREIPAASGTRRERILDRAGGRKIRGRRAELQSGTPGSSAQGF